MIELITGVGIILVSAVIAYRIDRNAPLNWVVGAFGGVIAMFVAVLPLLSK